MPGCQRGCPVPVPSCPAPCCSAPCCPPPCTAQRRRSTLNIDPCRASFADNATCEANALEAAAHQAQIEQAQRALAVQQAVQAAELANQARLQALANAEAQIEAANRAQLEAVRAAEAAQAAQAAVAVAESEQADASARTAAMQQQAAMAAAAAANASFDAIPKLCDTITEVCCPKPTCVTEHVTVGNCCRTEAHCAPPPPCTTCRQSVVVLPAAEPCCAPPACPTCPSSVTLQKSCGFVPPPACGVCNTQVTGAPVRRNSVTSALSNTDRSGHLSQTYNPAVARRVNPVA